MRKKRRKRKRKRKGIRRKKGQEKERISQEKRTREANDGLLCSICELVDNEIKGVGLRVVLSCQHGWTIGVHVSSINV